MIRQGSLALALVAVQPQHQLGVLADRRRVIAADLDADVAPEEPERAGDDQQHAALRPADAAAEEGAQVLDDLQVGEQVARRAHLGEAAVLELGAVDDADDAADRDRLRRRLELPDQARERAGVEHRVGVDRAEERVDRVVDAGVQRVGLAAVDLVDDDDARLERARVDAADQLRRDVRARHAADLDQAEGVGQRRHRLVGRAVVDHDDLELDELRGAAASAARRRSSGSSL